MSFDLHEAGAELLDLVGGRSATTGLQLVEAGVNVGEFCL
jgi:hypothetical protein